MGFEEFRGGPAVCREVREQLKGIYDLERLTSRVATGRASPRDLGCLSGTLARLPQLKQLLSKRDACLWGNSRNAGLVFRCAGTGFRDAGRRSPLLVSDGGIIRDGFDVELDRLRDLARGGKEWIAAYQASESERTGIPNLKVGFNKVFGYFLEVTAAHLAKGSRRVHSQADVEEPGTVRDSGVEGARGEGVASRRTGSGT
ncbi:MAG: hypothetical protein CM1200mP2_11300 [Planctomycetaceae bacterium]|nr:MAG: hypothetical protein CM1200mP2_11300 [Planctomycetaceae bacterium]